MANTKKRLLILTAVTVIAFVCGRLVVRGMLNLLLGGTMLGGNFL